MVVAKVVVRSLPVPEVRGSNPVINYYQVYWKDKNKEKRGRGGSILKNVIKFFCSIFPILASFHLFMILHLDKLIPSHLIPYLGSSVGNPMSTLGSRNLWISRYGINVSQNIGILAQTTEHWMNGLQFIS